MYEDELVDDQFTAGAVTQDLLDINLLVTPPPILYNVTC